MASTDAVGVWLASASALLAAVTIAQRWRKATGDPLGDPVVASMARRRCTAFQRMRIRYGPAVHLGEPSRGGVDLRQGCGWAISTQSPGRPMACQAHDGGGWEYYSNGPEGHELTLVRTMPDTIMSILPGRPLSDLMELPGDPGYVIVAAEVDRTYTRLIVADPQP